MISRYIRVSSLKFYMLLISAAGLLLLYALPTSKGLAALSAYQHFISMTADKTEAVMTEEQLDKASGMLERASQFEHGNPRWRMERGNFLHRATAESQPPAVKTQQHERFQEAEFDIKYAVLRDPANSWNYYELGRLELSRGNCSSDAGKLNAKCRAGKFFAAAIRFAPNSVFLRTIIGAWSYQYDRNMALRLIYEMVNEHPQHLRTVLDNLWPTFQDINVLRTFFPETQDNLMTFARFLYDQRLDYASDIERRRAFPDEKAIDCVLQAHQQNNELEIGNDDGTPEWRTHLTDDNERIKKELCVPDDITTYREAFLKLFISRGDPGDCTVLVSIDDTLIRQFNHRELPSESDWIDISFPPIVLYGKKRISVYVRTLGASSNGNFVNVWGDSDVPTTNSVFKFDSIDTLNQGLHAQGEYMIRLLLRKTAKNPENRTSLE
ncbi:hypothetical protein U14_03163 [Candidatus Moduliflexus flocculans]|uniref:Tetratricopeptide repeat protein n=1 Tax=Candidatus Moduliflexus flocculans TaxID=1499966 RepID=A0A081BNF1_9BACT|nr:hypothetical protein U14_03163 [Candidatus Moduliflexus flocculans]